MVEVIVSTVEGEVRRVFARVSVIGVLVVAGGDVVVDVGVWVEEDCRLGKLAFV